MRSVSFCLKQFETVYIALPNSRSFCPDVLSQRPMLLMRFDVSFPDSVTHTFLKEIETLLSDYPEPRFKPDALLDAATLAGMEDLQQQRMQQQRKKHQQARHQRLQALMSDDGSAAVVLQDSEVFSDDAAGPAP